MRTIALIAGVVAAWLISASPGGAQQLRYWGKQPGAATGSIELGHGQYYEVGAGTEIRGWGQVKEVGDAHLVVKQRLPEAEKDRLREQGWMPYDVLEIHIPREDLRFPSRVGPRRPHR